MAYLTLNGIAISVGYDSASRKHREIGEGTQVRAFDGTQLRTNRGFKREWAFTTVPDTGVNTQALVKLLQGYGDRVSTATDLYTDKGLVAANNTGASLGSGAGEFGQGVVISTGVNNKISWNFGITDSTNWTAIFYRKESGVFHQYFIRGDGTNYKDGSSYGGSTSFCAVDGSFNFVLKGNGSSSETYDDIWVVPYLMPTSWATQIADVYAGVKALPTSPTLELSGDVVQSNVYVFGVPGDSKYVGAASGGTFTDNLETLPFSLLEK